MQKWHRSIGNNISVYLLFIFYHPAAGTIVIRFRNKHERRKKIYGKRCEGWLESSCASNTTICRLSGEQIRCGILPTQHQLRFAVIISNVSNYKFLCSLNNWISIAGNAAHQFATINVTRAESIHRNANCVWRSLVYNRRRLWPAKTCDCVVCAPNRGAHVCV